jgi:TonB family protein
MGEEEARMPDSTQRPSAQYGRFICPHCQAINVEMGECKKCGADLETGELPDDEYDGGDDHGHHLRDMQSGGGLSKRQIMFGGAGILLLGSLLMMLMGAPKPQGANAPGTTTTTTTDTPYVAEPSLGIDGKPVMGPDGKPIMAMPKENSVKAYEMAAKEAGFSEQPPQSYVYEDTSAITAPIPSFGLTSELHNQRLLFIIWDNPAPLQKLELITQKPPFLTVSIPDLGKIKVAQGSGLVGGAPFKWFAGRYWNPEKTDKDKVEMAVISAFKAADPKKAIVLVARPFDRGPKIDYNSVIWLVDTMGAQAATTAGTASEAPKEAAAPQATPAQINAYRSSLEPLIRGKFNPPEDAKGKKVKVLFAVKQDGNLGKIEIAESSRNEMVDKAVLKAITSSAPFPKPPSSKENIEALVTTDGASLKLSGT